MEKNELVPVASSQVVYAAWGYVLVKGLVSLFAIIAGYISMKK